MELSNGDRKKGRKCFLIFLEIRVGGSQHEKYSIEGYSGCRFIDVHVFSSAAI